MCGQCAAAHYRRQYPGTAPGYTNPFEPDMANRLQPPSWQHFFGTDALGRDMFSRILYGGRASILLSLASAILSLGVGLVIGLFCGFYGGKLDMLCTVASNIFQAFRAAAL